MEQALIAPSLVVHSHPLAVDSRIVLFEKPRQGECLIDYVSRLKVPAVSGKPALHINGNKIDSRNVRDYKLMRNDLVEVRPSAAGDFDITSLIAVVALAVGAPVLSGHLINKFFLKGFAANLVRAGVALGGLVVASLFAPAIAQPPTRDNQEERTYSIGAARNTTPLWQPMMLVLGEHRVQPDNAATPITAFEGDDQYLTQAFHYGVGKLDINDRRIGIVSVNNYDDVEIEQSNAMTGGLESYPADVVALQGAELEYNRRVVRTLPEGSTEMALDFSGSLYELTKKGISGASVEVAIDISPSGKDQWQRHATINISNDNTKPIRRTNRYALADTAEQYDIGITKLTEDYDSAGSFGITNTIEVSQLKSYQPDNADYAGQVRDGVRIRATGQLSGQLDTYNALCRQIIPYWDSKKKMKCWIEEPTGWDARMQNPAAIFRAYVKGFYTANGTRLAGMGLPDELLDELSDWAEFCEDNNLTCNYVVRDASHAEVLDIITRCGRAIWDWHAGKLSVVFDQQGKPPVMLISPANIIKDSHTIEWVGSHDLAEQIVGRYVDPDNEWQHSTLRVPPNVTDAIERQANIELLGTTNLEQATKEINRQWASNQLLRRRQTWQMGMEAMLLRRGDLVYMSMPRIDTSGYLIDYDDSKRSITLSQPVDFHGQQEALLVLFDSSGSSIQTKIKPTQEANVVCIKGGNKQGYKGFKDSFEENGQWELEGVRFHFNIQPQKPQQVKIESIVWQSERQAQIIAVDHLPEYYDAENDIAVVEQTKKKFQTPEVIGAKVHQSWHYKKGVYERLLSLAFSVIGDYRSAAVYAGNPLEQVRRLDNSTRASWSIPASIKGNYPIVITPGEFGLSVGNPYRLAIRLKDNNLYPSNPASMSVEQSVSQHTTIIWNEVDNGDVAGYKIRIAVGLIGSWETMTPLHSGLLTASPHETLNLPPGTYTFAIKSVNFAGNESVGAAYHTASLNTDAPGQAAYFSNEGLRGWPGIRDKLVLDDSGKLHTDTSLTWKKLPSTWENWNSFLQSPVGEAIYKTELISFRKSRKVKALVSLSLSGDSQHAIEYQGDGGSWTAIPSDQIITAKTLCFRCRINTNSITPAVLSSFQIILVNQNGNS